MNLPYITPEKLLSRSNLPIKVDFAFVCFCPMPFIFENFKIDVKLENRLFLHTHNSHILFGEYQSQKFIVVSEVYGGPIGVTTVEELKYYGVKKSLDWVLSVLLIKLLKLVILFMQKNLL